MLNEFPKEYSIVRLQMKATDLEKITPENIISGLKAQDDEISIEEQEMKLETACTKNYRKFSDNKPSNITRSCYVCERKKHIARNYFYRKGNLTNVYGTENKYKNRRNNYQRNNLPKNQGNKPREKVNSPSNISNTNEERKSKFINFLLTLYSRNK